MPVHVRTRCPHCSGTFRADERLLGHKTNCPKCKNEFEIMDVLEPAAIQGPDHPRAVQAKQSAGSRLVPRTPSSAPPIAAPVAPVRDTVSAARANVVFSQALGNGTGRADDPLSQPQLDELRDTEQLRARIRVASVLCLIVFWAAVIYCIVFSIATLFAFVEARSPQARVVAGGLLITALVAGGIAALARIAGQANRRCERWAPMAMFVLEAVAVASNAIVGVVAAFEGGVVALVLMWVVAFLPGILAALFYRSWAAIPEYLARPAWCRRTLEYCGL